MFVYFEVADKSCLVIRDVQMYTCRCHVEFSLHDMLSECHVLV